MILKTLIGTGERNPPLRTRRQNKQRYKRANLPNCKVLCLKAFWKTKIPVLKLVHCGGKTASAGNSKTLEPVKN